MDGLLSYETAVTIVGFALTLAFTWGKLRQQVAALEMTLSTHSRAIDALEKSEKSSSSVVSRLEVIERNIPKIESIATLDQRMQTLEGRFEREMEALRGDVRELSATIREMMVAITSRAAQPARTKATGR